MLKYRFNARDILGNRESIFRRTLKTAIRIPFEPLSNTYAHLRCIHMHVHAYIVYNRKAFIVLHNFVTVYKKGKKETKNKLKLQSVRSKLFDAFLFYFYFLFFFHKHLRKWVIQIDLITSEFDRIEIIEFSVKIETKFSTARWKVENGERNIITVDSALR